MKTSPIRYLVVALPGIVGKAFGSTDLLDAVDCAKKAKADGFDGRIVTVFADGSMRDFDPAGKVWGADLQDSPFATAAALPDKKLVQDAK